MLNDTKTGWVAGCQFIKDRLPIHIIGREPMPVLIHGREYKTVAERVTEIHTTNKDKPLSIETDLVSWNEGVVIFKATVTTGGGIFTGYAYEHEGSSQINKTSALENCETSSIGRAVAAAGYSGTEYASANEVQNAINQQKNDEFKGAVTTAPKPLNKVYKQMLEYLATHKDHTVLSKSQKEKITTLVGKTLSMRDKNVIEKYHDNVMNLVSEHEARAKSQTIKGE